MVVGRSAASVASRRRAGAATGLAAVGLVGLVAHVVDPGQPGAYPVCPFLVATGFACPGCGSLRALHDLGSLDPVSALGHNALFVLVLAVVTVWWTVVLVHPSVQQVGTPRRGWAAVALVALVAWTIARNLPVHPFDVLAP